MTFGRLVPREHHGLLTRLRLARSRYSVACLSLFLAVDMDTRAAGLDSGNWWWYAHPDLDAIYGLGLRPEALDAEELPGFFLTCTTLKDPTKVRKGHHTLEAFAFVPYEPFRRWAESRCGERPEEYHALKRTLEARMVRAVAKLVPGIERRIVFSSLGTPLTNEHYCASSFGNLYGIEKSRFQTGPFGWPIETEVAGLLLCGASTLGHGVMGATFSGLAAAARALGCRTRDLLGQKGPALRTYPSEHPASWPEALRRRMGAVAAAEATAVA